MAVDKIKTSSPTLVHPPYLQMISEAINTLKDRTGSSQPAIAKFIEENYAKQLPQNFRKILSVQLKRFVKSEKLMKIKNSYKISKAPSNSGKEKTIVTTLKEEKKPMTKGTVKKKQGSVVVVAAKMSVEKAKKTKRLSQVKTPEALKKVISGMVKKGSGTTKKVKEVVPVKRKTVAKAKATPVKKSKK